MQDGKIYIEQLLCKVRARKMRGYPMRGVLYVLIFLATTLLGFSAHR